MSWELFHQIKQRLAAGDAEGVLAPLRALRQEWPEPALATVLADALAQLGRGEEAVACLQADIEAGVTNHWTFNSLGHLLANQWRITEAAGAFRRCHGLQGWSASEERGYFLTHDFISGHIGTWGLWFAELIRTAPIRILEVGSWQGGSTLWLLDHVIGPRGGSITCVDPWEGSTERAFLEPLGLTLEGLFDANVARTGLAERVHKIRGRSQEVLPTLEPGSFDFIYIDGAHAAQAVLQDAVYAHRLVAPGGFLLFNNPLDPCVDPPQHPGQAIDFFCRTFAADYRELDRGAQVLLQRQGPEMLPERLLLVLGMHRSGTSALSGALCQQGLCAPSDPEPASPANPTGHWEPQAILACHEALLAEAGTSWDDPLAPVERWTSTALAEHGQALEQALRTSFPQRRAGQVALVKDPRQCRLQPLWNALIARQKLQVAVVLMLRHPLAVAQSLQRRDQLPRDRSLLLWLAHTLEAERHTRDHRRCVVVYEQLLRDPEGTLQACLELVGLEEQAPHALGPWIQAGLNHAEASGAEVGDGALLELALGVYQRLAVLHGSAPDPGLCQWLDQAHGQLQERLQTLSHQSSRREMVQLFWEPATGGGFSEEHAVRASVAVTRLLAAVTLPLPKAATAPLALRLDPAEQPGLIQLRRLALLNAEGQTLWEGQQAELTPANPQTAVLENGDVVAGDADPVLLLTVPAAVLQQLGEGCGLRLEARWQPLSAEVAQRLLHRPG